MVHGELLRRVACTARASSEPHTTQDPQTAIGLLESCFLRQHPATPSRLRTKPSTFRGGHTVATPLLLTEPEVANFKTSLRSYLKNPSKPLSFLPNCIKHALRTGSTQLLETTPPQQDRCELLYGKLLLFLARQTHHRDLGFKELFDFATSSLSLLQLQWQSTVQLPMLLGQKQFGRAISSFHGKPVFR